MDNADRGPAPGTPAPDFTLHSTPDQSITLNSGSTLDGRALASTAAVTLASSTVTVPAPAGMSLKRPASRQTLFRRHGARSASDLNGRARVSRSTYAY